MNQLLPHPELAPQLRPGLTMEQRVAAWFEVMDWGDELLMAGLQRDLPEGLMLRDAVRQWYEQRTVEHDKQLDHMMRELSKRERNHGN